MTGHSRAWLGWMQAAVVVLLLVAPLVLLRLLGGHPPDDHLDGEGDHLDGEFVVLEGQLPDGREVGPVLLAKYLVTNKDYAEFLRANPEHERPRFWGEEGLDDPMQPVVGVSWFDACVYCEWAGGRLPTVEEWELACQLGGDERGSYSFLDELPRVGLKAPSEVGLYDILGLTTHWCLSVPGDLLEQSGIPLEEVAREYGAEFWEDPWDGPVTIIWARRGAGWKYPAEEHTCDHQAPVRAGGRQMWHGFRLARPVAR